jgi:hypothetical protein
MSDRAEILARVRLPKGDKRYLTMTDAARLLGVTRQRISQLVKKGVEVTVEKPFREASAYAPTAPPTLQQTNNPAPPVNTPTDLNAVLSPIGEKPANPQPQPNQTNSAPKGSAENPEIVGKVTDVDPEDAAAGRDLLKYLIRVGRDAVAKFVYNCKPDDPKMLELKDPNEFLKLALKRNQDKAAPLGKLTRGWWGLGIGAILEGLRLILIADPGESKPEEKKPEAPKAGPMPEKPVAVEAVTEPEAPRRLSLQDKVNLFNGGK